MTILEKVASLIDNNFSLRRLMKRECPNNLFDNTVIPCADDPNYSCDKCWLQPFNEKIHCKVGNFDYVVDHYLKNDDDLEIERIEKVSKFNVITLCGSTRFKDAFLETQKRLTLEGNIVISVGLFGHSGDSEAFDDETKKDVGRNAFV